MSPLRNYASGTRPLNSAFCSVDGEHVDDLMSLTAGQNITKYDVVENTTYTYQLLEARDYIYGLVATFIRNEDMQTLYVGALCTSYGYHSDCISSFTVCSGVHKSE